MNETVLVSRKRGRTISRRTVLDTLAVLVFIASAVIGILFVRRYAVNTVYFDQFTDINLIKHAHSGTLSFGLLWAQHNENRVFFPNLIVLALAYTTRLNIIFEQYLSLAFWYSTIGLIIVSHKRRSQMSLIYYCPVVVVMLSLTPVSAALFGYRMSWFLALLGLGGALFLLDRPQLSRLVMIGAITAAVVGSFSAFQGLFIWPAGLVLLYLRRRTKAVKTVWIVSAVVTGVLYFANYSFLDAAGSGSESYVFGHPLVALSFFFSSIGNVVNTSYGPGVTAVDYPVLLLGVMIFAVAISALIKGVRGNRSDGSPIGVALICFGLLFVASITFGRTFDGLSQTGGRYSIFALMIWVGAYLSLFGSPLQVFGQHRWASLMHWWSGTGSGSTSDIGVSERPSIPWRQASTAVAALGLLGLMFIQVASGDLASFPFARYWDAGELTDANVMVNIDKAPNVLVENELGRYPAPFERKMTAYARSQHLSVFATNLVARYTKEGLPPAPPPVTSITSPTNGATLTGFKWIVASATDIYGVTKVEFRLTGGALHGADIATGAIAPFGWLAGWNPVTVPNGTYKLQSVAYDAGGTSSRSASITITVADKSHH